MFNGIIYHQGIVTKILKKICIFLKHSWENRVFFSQTAHLKKTSESQLTGIPSPAIRQPDLYCGQDDPECDGFKFDLNRIRRH